MRKITIILIVSTIVCVSFLSGCNEIGLINIGDLSANPQKYLDKEVRVKGTLSLTIGQGVISDEQGHTFPIKYNNMTTLTGNYYLTGIVKTGLLGQYYYLDIIKADAV